MLNRLRHLLDPVGPETFVERCWGRLHLHIERQAADYWDAILRVADIDVFLQSKQLPAAFVNVVTNGKLHPNEEWSHVVEAARGEVRVAIPEHLLALYRNGATIILNQAHNALPNLSGACGALSLELGFPVHGNVYLTPPNAQGFRPHADDHEVFVLMVFGEKSFKLHPKDAASAEIHLHAGDLLYVPRELMHEARSMTAASVHVTIGLKPIYAFRLVEELAARARQSPDFRQAAPLGPLASEQAWAEFQDQFAASMRDLMSHLSVKTLAERLIRAQEDRSAAWPNRFSDLLRIADAAPDTMLVARSGVVPRLEEEGQNLHVCFSGSRVTLPRFLKAAVDRILDGRPFAIQEIPGMLSEQGRKEIARSLVESGLVTFESRKTGS